MDIDELAGWFAFFNVHGHPDMRSEFYGAQIASLMCQIVSKKGQKYKTSDFMLDEQLETRQERIERDEREFRNYLLNMAGKK